MTKNSKYESNMVQLVQQFAHATRWADGDKGRLQELRDAIQGVVQGQTMPGILQRQISRVVDFLRRYGGESGFRPEDIPSAPTSERQLILAVYLPDKDGEPGWLRTLRDWWQFDCFRRANNWLWSDFKFDTSHLRLVPGVEYTPGIFWVEYEPNAYLGKSPEQVLKLAEDDGVQLAGAEPIMAAVLLDDYVGSWSSGNGAVPNLTAYQYNEERSNRTAWSHVPYPHRGVSRLGLCADWAGYAYDRRSSPVVRRV